MPIQARTEFAAAINQIASEKGVETEVIIDAIKQAALAAYRKDLSFRNEPIPDDFEELTAKLDPSSGEISIWRGETNITPPGFARIAAQTAKQVITQKLHEAEKGAIVDEYAQKVGTVVSGAIQRQEGSIYFVDLGRAEGILPPPEQVRDEYYGQNQRMKFYIKEIRESGRGPEVIVSRSDPSLVKGLFALEVPELQSGTVEIKEIAREAGGRCKVAVTSHQDGVDPVGSLVGQKGVRVQAVINELGEEKIDIILYSGDPQKFIAAALSPAKEVQVSLNEENKVATVKIPDNQLSLAIGKGGQNVRLAAKLTGWKIDIEGTGESQVEGENVTHSSSGGKGKEEKTEKVEEPKEEGTNEQKEADQSDQTQDATQTVAAPETTESEQDEAIDESVVKEAVETDVDKAVEKESAEGKIQEESSDEGLASTEETATEGVAEESEFEKVEEERNKQSLSSDEGEKEEQAKNEDNSGDKEETKE